jgi:rhomboid protease GluP
MNYVSSKTKLVFLPLLWLSVTFIITYSFFYWLFYIKLNIIPLKKAVIDLWIPMALSSLAVFIFIRPRIHLLKLDKNDGKVRTLYYLVGAAVTFVPTMILMSFLDSATGKLTRLNSITEIREKPITKYYTANSYVLHKSHIGIESTMTYSGKHNQNLNFDIYIAMPFAGELYDTLESPSAFLAVKYHKQISSHISDEERNARWEQFWKESFKRFDKEAIRFMYLERMENTEERDNLLLAAQRSELYKEGLAINILKLNNEPFAMRNGNKLRNASIVFVTGLLVWFIMILIPGLHVNKIEKAAQSNRKHVRKELQEIYRTF